MSTSPYIPPNAPIQDAPSESVTWWVVWIAASSATGAAYLVGSVLSPFFQHWFAWEVPKGADWYQVMVTSPIFALTSLMLTACAYVQGGYVAAALSQSLSTRHAAAAGAVCIAIGAIAYLGIVPSPLPYWAQSLGFLMTFPCFLLGAKWQTRTRARLLPVGREDV